MDAVAEYLPRDIVEHVLYRYLEHPTASWIKANRTHRDATVLTLWRFVLKKTHRSACPRQKHTMAQHRALYSVRIAWNIQHIHVRACRVCGLVGADVKDVITGEYPGFFMSLALLDS